MNRSLKTENVASKVADCVESGEVRLSDHAVDRMRQQNVSWFEVEDVLASGWHVPEHDQWSEENHAWNYAIEGVTAEGREVRVPVAFVEDGNTLVVTVIDSPY
jgi:hypothetical protein